MRNPTKHLLREENPAGESRAKLLSNGTGACRGEAGVIQHPAPSGLEIAAWVRKLCRESCSLTPPGKGGWWKAWVGSKW